MNRLE
jgi:hypothetical protein